MTTPVTISSGQSVSVTSSSANQYIVLNGGALVVTSGGSETGAVISAGGTETVSSGSVTGDTIYGVLNTVASKTATLTGEQIQSGGVLNQLQSATASNTSVFSGGTYNLNGNTSATNVVLEGGALIELSSPKATLLGTLTFSGGNNDLDILSAVTTATGTYGEQATLVGFGATDKIDVTALGSGASLSFSTSGGNEIVTVSASKGSERLVFSGTTSYTSATLAVVSSGGAELIEYSASGFGNVVTISSGASSGLAISSGQTVSVVAGGTVVSAQVASGGTLSVAGGVDANAVVSAGGQEIVVSGSASGDAIYGSLTTLSGGAAVLTSETVESGGVLTLANGASASGVTVLSGGVMNISGADLAASGILLDGGALLDLQSPKASVGGVLSFANGGNALKIDAVASAGYGVGATISGFSTTDRIDVTALGSSVSLAFASNADGTETVTLTGGSASETLIFDSAAVYNAFTLQTASDGSGGVDLVFNPNATSYTVSSGTASGLVVSSGETLTVAPGATASATKVLSGGVYVVSGTDVGATVSGAETVFGSASGDAIYGATTVSGAMSGATVQSGGSLTLAAGAATGAKDIVLAGGSESVVNGGTATSETISGTATVSGPGASFNGGLIAAGGVLDVLSGATASGAAIAGSALVSGAGAMISAAVVSSGGVLTVSSGAVDSGATLLAGATEFVYGSASGDQIYGSQLVSATSAVVSNETVHAGGALTLGLKGAMASGTVVSSGGQLNISGNAYASNTVLSGGGVLNLETAKAEVTGSLTFAGGGNLLEITGTTSGGYGVLATISGFSATDKIDISSAAFASSGLTLSQFVNGSDTVAEVLSGGVAVETFMFADASLNGALFLTADGAGGVDLEIRPAAIVTSVTSVTSVGAYTETNGDTLLVLSGGDVTSATIEAGAYLVVNGGVDHQASVLSGATETLSAGSALGDVIRGSAVAFGGLLSGAEILSGGQATISGGVAQDIALTGGATLDLATSGATLSGALDFSGGANDLKIDAAATISAVISGFSTSDKIDLTGISASGASLSYMANADGTETVTVSGAGGSESFTFSNQTDYGSGKMAVFSDGSSGVELVKTTTPVITFTSLGGFTNQASYDVNGKVDVSADPEAVGKTVDVYESVDGKSVVVGTGTVNSSGYWTAKVAFGVDDGANVLTASVTDAAGQTGTTASSLSFSVNTTASAFTAGNLVISISGDGDGSGSYGDNQASPITIEQITTSGSYVSQLVLPQTTTTVNGVTEYAISGEYGSSSEGSLQLSADGHSLVIAGYGVNAATYNSGGAAVYGNAALAQTTSVQGGAYAAVARVVADISASGSVDASTALYNIYNTQNPRSVATVDGSSFWLSGQGVKGSANQGVFYATDGSSAATAINTATDTRTAEIYNGVLYVSADSAQGATNIESYGALPTSSTTGTVLTGLSTSVTLTVNSANTVNGADIGQTVYLSPENFFFADANTLYVADGGNPKNGGLGDGGLQKWSYDTATGGWALDYTLSAGLNLVADTNTHGTSGLIGLTGEVIGGVVYLYATNSTLSDLDQTYVYAISDTLSATTASQVSSESFTAIFTASAGENIRGISFAPTGYAPSIEGAKAWTTVAETPTSVFAGVTIADRNSNGVETLTITISGGGTLADGAGYSGLVNEGAGVYQLSGTASAVTAELDATIFTAAAGATVTLKLSDLSSAYATAASDQNTVVTDTICFLAGTMIATPDGEKPVEDFARGDLVVTADGKIAAVAWLGRQTVVKTFADPVRSFPIRIRADALGANLPKRDLLVSPDHALLLDGVLVHAGALVNGSSIARETPLEERFVYFHIELDDHALILAENIPAETFIDNVERMAFDNWDEHLALYPQGKCLLEMATPRAKSARQVPAKLRRKILARAEQLGLAQKINAA